MIYPSSNLCTVFIWTQNHRHQYLILQRWMHGGCALDASWFSRRKAVNIQKMKEKIPHFLEIYLMFLLPFGFRRSSNIRTLVQYQIALDIRQYPNDFLVKSFFIISKLQLTHLNGCVGSATAMLATSRQRDRNGFNQSWFFGVMSECLHH